MEIVYLIDSISEWDEFQKEYVKIDGYYFEDLIKTFVGSRNVKTYFLLGERKGIRKPDKVDVFETVSYYQFKYQGDYWVVFSSLISIFDDKFPVKKQFLEEKEQFLRFYPEEFYDLNIVEVRNTDVILKI